MNTSSITQADLDTFVEAYVSCALWSESIGEDFARQWSEQTGEDFAPDVSLEGFGFTADDIAADALSSITSDCRDFLEGCGSYLDAYLEHKGLDSAGHDFWLTRNGHGAGFWDRGLGELGDILTAMAKPYGESNLYVGDDEELHVA